MLARVAHLEARGLLAEPLLVRFAVLFHDVIYDARAAAPSNEVASADAWRDFAASAATHLTPAQIDRVAAYIERTATHMDGPAAGDLAHFLDADLAVLGGPPAAYAEYARQVRLEYAHVPTPAFVAGRSRVLARFLAAPQVYFSREAADEGLEARARANLEAEIARLGRRGGA